MDELMAEAEGEIAKMIVRVRSAMAAKDDEIEELRAALEAALTPDYGADRNRDAAQLHFLTWMRLYEMWHDGARQRALGLGEGEGE